MAADDVYELVYSEAMRALEHQHTALAELRGRASTLIATAAISTSFRTGACLLAAQVLATVVAAAIGG